MRSGPALAGLDVPFAVSQRARLETARLVAVQERVQADLDCGAHREVIGELEGLVREHPDEERLWGQLMLALYRSGSQGASLRACNRLRRHLVEELGVNPSPEICDLEKAILLQDPALAWLPADTQSRAVPTSEPRAPTGAGVRALGPDVGGTPPTSPASSGSESVRSVENRAVADLIRAARRTSTSGKHPRRSDFLPLVGREHQLDALARVIEAASREADVRLAVVDGDAGCGKTRLLHELAARAHVNDRLVVLTSAEDDDVLPYRAFADLVREVLASSLASTYLEQLGPLVGDLAWLVPKALSPPTLPMADARLARMRLFEAVVELSKRGREEPGTVVPCGRCPQHGIGDGRAAGAPPGWRGREVEHRVGSSRRCRLDVEGLQRPAAPPPTGKGGGRAAGSWRCRRAGRPVAQHGRAGPQKAPMEGRSTAGRPVSPSC